MTEKQMEDLIAAFPNDFSAFYQHRFVLLDRQGVLASVGRFDLLFEDRHKTKILMELKARALSYADASQVAHYRDELKRQGQDNVMMWLVAPHIPAHVREFLDEKGIEYSEIHEAEFRRVAERHDLPLKTDKEISGTREMLRLPTRSVSQRDRPSDTSSVDGNRDEEIVAVDVQDLLQMEFSPREFVVDQLLPLRGKCMVTAPKGPERAHFVAQLAYSIASGIQFFRWSVPRSHRVMCVEGDAIGVTLQSLKTVIDLNGGHRPEGESLRIVNRDLQGGRICRIDSPDGKDRIQSKLSAGHVLVLDDVNSLHPGVEKLGAREWARLGDWIADLARQEVSTVIVSPPLDARRRGGNCIDGLDSTIILRPSSRPSHAALGFEVQIGSIGGQPPKGPRNQPFEVRQNDFSGAPGWKIQHMRDELRRRAEQMIRDGAKPNEVVKETGLSRFAIHRIRQRLKLPNVAADHQ